MRYAATFVAALFAVGCEPEPPTPEPIYEIDVGGSVARWDDDRGWLQLDDAAGNPILVGATASLMLDATDETGLPLAMDDDRERTLVMDSLDGALGSGERLLITRHGADGEPDMTWAIVGYPDSGAWTFDLSVNNTLSAPLQLAKASPLVVPREPGRGLYVGHDPATHRVLENGSYTVFDFVVEIRPGDAEPDPWGEVIPGDFAGHSVSNWNHAIVDLEGGPAWVAGALSLGTSSPLMNLSYEAPWARPDDGGRMPFTFLALEAAYTPGPKLVAPGAELTSDLYRVHPTETDAQRGLERHASAVAAHLGVVPWHRREAGRRVPNGWNSWSGSGSTGGYGTGIDEDVILANLDVVADELRDWGMEWFQLDDGYEPAYGDWWWREDRFPHGPAWMSQQIRDRGLRPGLWMAPFTLDPDSETAQAHPDWLADTTAIGDIVGTDYEILDLTNPEVQQWLTELFTTFTQEWGFEWLKMDFAYYALFGDDFEDADATREEAWRQGMAAVREGIGPETFFLGVGAVGINYDLLDSSRTTLDTMPVWDQEPGLSPGDHLSAQGLKPTLRTAGRRWYLQDRVWVNHPDLLFFRSNTLDEDWPPLTETESRAFASWIGMTGGIVKLGDRLVDLTPESIDVIRRLMPIHPTAARPVDLFEREYPRIWHLEIDEPMDGYTEAWHVVGLFEWGWNQDLTTNPYTVLPDPLAPETMTVPLSALGADDGPWLAYEFWTAAFLGEVEDALVVEVPSHDSRVVALRRPTGAPQFLGWNRQLSMGGTLLEAATWDDAADTLTLRAEVAAGTEFAPFEYDIALYVPDGFTVDDATPSGPSMESFETVDEGAVVRLRFVPEQTGDLEVVVTFSRD